MSDSNNHLGDIQDYLDLLGEYEEKSNESSTLKAKKGLSDSEVTQFKKPSPPPMKGKFEVIKDTEPEKNQNNNNDEKKPVKKEKNVFKWFKNLSVKKKVILSIIAVILIIAIVLASIAVGFVKKKLDLIGDNTDIYHNEDIIYEEEEIDDIEIDIGSSDFKQSLIDWATTDNDKHMTSKNVINVLLIGADSRRGKNEGNTDVMMVVSVNKKTKQLKLISFLRDSYLYIEGNKSSYCTKLNAAFSMGGPDCLIQTIENNYKISIDNYVMVNFESFKEIIDAMGGINVDVQAYEANYIESHYKVAMPIGDDVKLNGEQALVFCRVRNCDSDGDVSRTRRQRQVIDSMVDRIINSSISEINKYIDILLPYVDTGYSESQIISLGIKAITNGWATYDRTQLSMPSEECRTSGSVNMWIWVIDYQKAAHDLQIEIYGESNIKLPENRTTIIDIYRGASYYSSTTGNTNSETTAPNTTVPVTQKPVETTEKTDDVEEETLSATSENTETQTQQTETNVDVSNVTQAESEENVVPENKNE